MLRRLLPLFLLVAMVVPAFAQAQLLPAVAVGAAVASKSCGLSPACWAAYALSMGGQVMLWVLHFVSLFIEPLLIGPNFITNDLVKAGWPFVLGIANLGFVLALLFIATLTVLGLGGYDVRRALVRLLIAAVLINFSLLIAGVILDVSRLAMAIILRLVGDIPPSEGLGFSLLKASKVFTTVFQSVFDKQTGTEEFKFIAEASVFEALKANVLIAGTTIIFVVLFFSLLARWLVLIGLLIMSPLAYLAYAMPGLTHRSEQWWKMFLTYVLYGPVVAFILAIAVQGGNLMGKYVGGLAGFTPDKDPIGAIGVVTLVVTLALMFLATQAGKFLGLAGALSITTFAKNAVRGTAGFARRHPILAGAAIAGPAGAAAGAGAAVGTVAAKYAGGALKTGVKQATIGVIDEAVAGRAGKALKAYQKVAAGTAKKEDYEELEKSPFWRGVASVVSKIPGAGGRAGIGSKLEERRQRRQAAMDVADEAGRLERAGDPAGAENLVRTAPQLQGLAFAEVDDEFNPDQTKRVLRLGNQAQKKQMLKEPAVIKKLLEDTAPGGGRDMLIDIKAKPAERVQGISDREVEIQLENTIRTANPKWTNNEVRTQVRADLPARLKFTRETVADENRQRQTNKELIDAIEKGENELHKKEFGS